MRRRYARISVTQNTKCLHVVPWPFAYLFLSKKKGSDDDDDGMKLFCVLNWLLLWKDKNQVEYLLRKSQRVFSLKKQNNKDIYLFVRWWWDVNEIRVCVCATFGWTINFSCGCILSILSTFADHVDDNVTRLKNQLKLIMIMMMMVKERTNEKEK